jgi:hypothetical protein
METKTAKIVNRAYAGQPEDIVLQDIETNQIFEFSQIVGETITNGDLSHPIIQRILNNGHIVQITYNEANELTLHF